VLVTDRERLVALSQARATSGQQLAGAALGVVICADETISDCWIEDCSIAAITLQLTATHLGLGSCWVQIRGREHADGRPAEEHVREILGLPSSQRVLCMISVGYPAEEKPPVAANKLPWDKVIFR
jgi:nitroreductase